MPGDNSTHSSCVCPHKENQCMLSKTVGLNKLAGVAIVYSFPQSSWVKIWLLTLYVRIFIHINHNNSPLQFNSFLTFLTLSSNNLTIQCQHNANSVLSFISFHLTDFHFSFWTEQRVKDLSHVVVIFHFFAELCELLPVSVIFKDWISRLWW